MFISLRESACKRGRLKTNLSKQKKQRMGNLGVKESGSVQRAAAECPPAVRALAPFLFLQKSLGLAAPEGRPSATYEATRKQTTD